MPVATMAELWVHFVADVLLGPSSISPCGIPGCRSRSSGCSSAALRRRRLYFSLDGFFLLYVVLELLGFAVGYSLYVLLMVFCFEVTGLVGTFTALLW